MTPQELYADGLASNFEFLKAVLADFSDADLLARPCPGANHTAWQLGHLIVAETNMLNAVKPGTMPELPAGFAERFSKENTKVDDPKAFPKKDDLLNLFTKARAATINFAKSASQKDLDQKIEGRMARMVPTVAHLLGFTPVHVAMHVGQFQVIRRKLGKPILF